MYLGALVFDCKNPERLADFYAALLGWEKSRYDEEWVTVKSTDGTGAMLVFQLDEGYAPPVWPGQPGGQRQMVHPDFYTDDVVGDVRHAIACGARLNDTQCDDGWRVLLDPEGHPFCILPTTVPDEETKAAIAALCQSH